MAIGVHPNSPLALVAAEVRFPPVSDQAFGKPIYREMRDLIGSEWVITDDIKITSRQGTKVITVQPDMVSVEVSDYSSFDDFRSLLRSIASSVERVIRPNGISRLGLRYFNEITVPETLPDWSRWLHQSAIQEDPLGDDEMQPQHSNLLPSRWSVLYTIEPDRRLALSCGTSDESTASPYGPPERSSPVDGQVFSIGLDSFWQPSETPEFTANIIIEAADSLHVPLAASLADRRVIAGGPSDEILSSILYAPRVRPPARIFLDSVNLLASTSGALRNSVQLLANYSEILHTDVVELQLNERTKQTERQSIQNLLEFVSDAGFSWTAISSLLGVSIAETRKWRQGESISSHDRNQLARFVAFCEIVTEERPEEHVASWMEDTLDEDSYATGLDVYAAGKINELVQFAAGHIEANEMLKRAGLDNNRSKEFEIFQAKDGENAVRVLATAPTLI